MGRVRRFERPEPLRKSGNLYYARLKTEYGIFYKLGFTTFDSVQKRLGYDGSNDAQYIDKTLLFVYLQDAFEVECRLHQYLSEKRAFGKYSAMREFPLCKNGQTELYIEDVLHLDPDCTEKQTKDTTLRLKNKRRLIAGKSQRQEQFEDIFFKMLMPILLFLLVPIGLVIVPFFAWLNGESIKEELLGFFDRLTGSKKQKAADEAKLKENIEREMRRILYERDRQVRQNRQDASSQV